MRWHVVVGLIGLVACRPSSDRRSAPTEPLSLRGASCDTYIVQLTKDAGPASAWAKAHGVSPTFVYTRALNGLAASLCGSSASGLSHSPHVKSITASRPIRIKPPSGDPVQSPVPSWGLDRIDQATLSHNGSLDGKYFYWPSAGSGVTAYIIDSGIRCTHVDVVGRCGGGADFVLDGNGTSDCLGHGSHVAGTVGGTTYGVAKLVSLVPVRIFSCAGSADESVAIAALDWVILNGVHPGVVNASFTSDGINAALDLAVENTIAAGFLVVTAAGNSAADACNYSPARVPSALTVGNSKTTDVPHVTSNWGPCLDLYAPGTSIKSLWFPNDTAVLISSGTSMAAPHATGAAALYLSLNPFASPAAVTAYLLSTVTVDVLTQVQNGSPNRLLRTHATSSP